MQPNLTTGRNPPVTQADVERELEYWMEQLPLYQLIEILAEKIEERSHRRTATEKSRPSHERYAMQQCAISLNSVSRLLFMALNK